MIFRNNSYYKLFYNWILWNIFEIILANPKFEKIERKIVYFLEPGLQNTDETIRLVKERVKELNIKYVVVATNIGTTAVKATESLADMNIKIAIYYCIKIP